MTLRRRNFGVITGVVAPDEDDAPAQPAGLRAIRPGDQNYPQANDLPSMHDQARQDLEGRKQLGIERYGQPLQPANGRNAARDLYEEVLDAAAYGAQVMYEQDHPEETYVGCLVEALATGNPVDFKGRFVPEQVQDLIVSWAMR